MTSGIIRAVRRFKYVPPNNAIAATGVAFGRCGISRKTMPSKIMKYAIKVVPSILARLYQVPYKPAIIDFCGALIIILK
jgi:hypothetical protein